jgi:F420-dependent oxidoreductase-like protein
MRIGIFANLSGGEPQTLDGLIEQIASRVREGYASVWLAHIRGEDALMALALAGSRATGVELGTAVVPIHNRHPMLMAQQALTAQAATGGRLTLGLGLSHKSVVEESWGLSFERPVEYMREYLAVLLPLLRGEAVTFGGERFRVNGQLSVPGSPAPPPVLLAALGTKMLQLCGEHTEGTITWMVGPRTLESHIRPVLNAAAEAAGRPAPRIVVGLPLCVTDDVEAARARAARNYVRYGTLPSYRAMLDREGVEDPASVCVIGSESSVRDQLAALESAGATDFYPAVFGSRDEQARAHTFLRSVVADGRLAAV